MAKRLNSNYSLWPEQARTNRVVPVTLAIGGFAIGTVCAVAALAVISDILRPALPQASRLTDLWGPAVASVPAVSVNRDRRRRARSAKVTLPIIGTQTAAPSTETEGHGGPDDPARLASLTQAESEPAMQPQAGDAAPDQAKPAAVNERPASKPSVRKKREQPINAAHSHSKRAYSTRKVAHFSTRNAAHVQPNRAPSAYSIVSATASWY